MSSPWDVFWRIQDSGWWRPPHTEARRVPDPNLLPHRLSERMLRKIVMLAFLGAASAFAPAGPSFMPRLRNDRCVYVCVRVFCTIIPSSHSTQRHAPHGSFPCAKCLPRCGPHLLDHRCFGIRAISVYVARVVVHLEESLAGLMCY